MGKVFRSWQAHDMAFEPNTGDNVVHASASPFEGLAERMNWLETPCRKDSYCQALVRAGVKEAVIKAWSVDPQVNIDGGKKGSLFDSLEDLDASACIQKAKALQALQ